MHVSIALMLQCGSLEEAIPLRIAFDAESVDAIEHARIEGRILQQQPCLRRQPDIRIQMYHPAIAIESARPSLMPAPLQNLFHREFSASVRRHST